MTRVSKHSRPGCGITVEAVGGSIDRYCAFSALNNPDGHFSFHIMKREKVEAFRDMRDVADAQENSQQILDTFLSNNPHIDARDRKKLKEISSVLQNTYNKVNDNSKKLAGETVTRAEDRVRNYLKMKGRSDESGHTSGKAQKGLLSDTTAASGVSPLKKKGRRSDGHVSEPLSQIMAFNARAKEGTTTAASSAAKKELPPRRATSSRRMPKTNKKASRGKAAVGSPLDYIPAPEDGKQYRRAEIAKILSEYKKLPDRPSPSKYKIMEALAGTSLVAFVGVSNLYGIADSYFYGIPISDWGLSGAQMLMPVDEIKAFVDEHTASGASLTEKDMEKKLEEVARDRAERSGNTFAFSSKKRCDFKPDRMTVGAYMQIALTLMEESGEGGKRQADTVKEKSYSRITAAGSIMSLVCDTIAASAAIFRVVDFGTAYNVSFHPLCIAPFPF